jgi:hypothetical protein
VKQHGVLYPSLPQLQLITPVPPHQTFIIFKPIPNKSFQEKCDFEHIGHG